MPGQIRCPTCHRSTPPTAFCTQCGTAIPESARARPRGLDREELQDRIRGHRPGDAAFRRGSQVGGGEQGSPTYRPYQPEPEDGLVLPGAAADEAGVARVDNTAPDFDEPLPPVVTPPPVIAAPPIPPPVVAPEAAGVEPPPVAPPAVEPPAVPPAPAPVVAKAPRRQPQPAPWKPAPPPPTVESSEAPPPQWTAPEEPYAAEPEASGYGYRDRGDDRNRRGSGMGPLAIGGFVLLGVLAIGVGAFMAGLFSGGTALGSPSPTPLLSTLPSASAVASLEPSTVPSLPASGGATATPIPIGSAFTASTQPCAEQPASQDGCGSSGATVTGGSVWVWVGWRKGSDADTIGVHIEDGTGAEQGTGSLALSTIGANGCGASCNGWARFKFGGLDPGDYTIKVDRNGEPVAEATFTVNS